jgi:hypothetical protein
MPAFKRIAIHTLLAIITPAIAWADQAERYQLKYKLRAGEMVVTRVVHQSHTQTAIAGEDQDSSSQTSSVKTWQVQSVDPSGNMTFVYSIDNVQMQQSIGDETQAYDSQTDAQVPEVFKNVAQSVNVPLATITISPSGEVVARDKEFRCPLLGIGDITIALPKEPLSIGAQWHVPRELHVRLDNGSYKTIKVRELYSLEKVSAGVATISLMTQPLTPVNDPAIEAQLVQQLSKGTIKFDIDSGRLISKRLDWSEHVLGFRGAESSMRYDATWTEELVPSSARTANRGKMSR